MDSDRNSCINGQDMKKNEIINKLKLLLAAYPEGLFLNKLEKIYKTKFYESLLVELIKIALPDALDKFAITSCKDSQNDITEDVITLKKQKDIDQRQHEQLQEIRSSDIVLTDLGYLPTTLNCSNENGSLVDISNIDEKNQPIDVKSEEHLKVEIDQRQEALLQEISSSGIVPTGFVYVPTDGFNCGNEKDFFAYVSNIDEHNHLICIQPEENLSRIEEFTKCLDSYYSNPISEELLVKDLMVGLACVSQYEEIYHRVLIKENYPTHCVVQYVDLGIIKEIKTREVPFKYLLDYFAYVPCMAFECRLGGIHFKLDNYQTPPKIYSELDTIFQRDRVLINPCVEVFDRNDQCLNDIVVQKALAFKANELSTTNSEHCLNSRNINEESSNFNNEINKTTNAPDQNTNYLFTEYEQNTPTEPQLTQTHVQVNTANSDYMIEDSSILGNFDGSKKSNISQRSNQRDERKGSKSKNQSTLKITFDPNAIDERRLVKAALGSLSRSASSNRRKVSDLSTPKKLFTQDKFADWMRSRDDKQSLWSNVSYKDALITYIGRIYGQRIRIGRIFTKLYKENRNDDELDLLKQVIEKAKEQHDAQMSLDKWEDNSRVNRRVQDLKFILEFNGNSPTSNDPFIVTPTHLQQVIDRRKILSYFDLGCGDGVMTAGIGAYLSLNKENIFGGDVYEGQCENVTFVKINENESKINLPDNHVDLITSFVTFHHISQIKEMIIELARILRPGGYLILREHNCKNEYSLLTKYLNFIHAIMMIAKVGEFADSRYDNNNENETMNWSEQKSYIIEYTKTIHYRTCEEWKNELESVGFHLCATYSYGANGSRNPQELFYAVYQLHKN